MACFSAGEIARLLKVREKVVHDGESEENDTLFSIAVKMKELSQLKSSVMMNSYFQQKLHCYFLFCDDFR
jgi:GTP-dependent phosphoenolpyruvate carboxykinase